MGLETRTFPDAREASKFIAALKGSGVAPYVQNRGRTVIWDTTPQIRATSYPWAVWMDGNEHTITIEDLSGSTTSWVRTARERARSAGGYLEVTVRTPEMVTFRCVPDVVPPTRYPWDEWADGEWHTVRAGEGEHRMLTAGKLVSAIRSRASAQELRCEVARDSPNVVRFRIGDQRTP